MEVAGRGQVIHNPGLKQKWRKACAFLALLLTGMLLACSTQPLQAPDTSPRNTPDTGENLDQPGSQLSEADKQALASLIKIDPYPLYLMEYAPDRSRSQAPLRSAYANVLRAHDEETGANSWGCALVSITWDPATRLFGRNFDWEYSPALLLHYQPLEGYPSVAMVDLDYLFDDDDVQRLDELSLDQRLPLLDAHRLPFDGMNASGLVIGMAAVPDSPLPENPTFETVGSLAIIRRLLDQAEDVEAALEILARVKPSWGQGPALHYLLSDASGRSVLVEFIDGEMLVLESSEGIQIATNFLQRSAGASPAGRCWRYDRLQSSLEDISGETSSIQMMELLATVSQSGEGTSTQWSIVYDFRRGALEVAMGRDYANLHYFSLPISAPD